MPYTDDNIPFVRGSATSEAAAKKAVEFADHLRDLMLESLRRDGPQTDDELQERFNLAGHTESPRRIELRDRGLVVGTGAVRKSRAGRMVIVWAAVSGNSPETQRKISELVRKPEQIGLFK
jgi:hypothetical protein